MRPSFSPKRLLRLMPVCEGLQERYELIFLFIGQPEVADRRVHVL